MGRELAWNRKIGSPQIPHGPFRVVQISALSLYSVSSSQFISYFFSGTSPKPTLFDTLLKTLQHIEEPNCSSTRLKKETRVEAILVG